MRVAVLVGRWPEERYSLHRGYVDALRAVGATPVVVPAGPGGTSTELAELLPLCDALLTTGGGDVAPVEYGEQVVEPLVDVDPDRDALELTAVRRSVAEGRPVLGICRGAQLVAVALGGTLVQDLPGAGCPGHWEEVRQYEPVHGIRAEPGSAAEQALGGATTVNSIHHQAVHDPGPGLRASAWSPDGAVEAVEGPGVLGVQWHPERLVGSDPRHLAPFAWLRAAVANEAVPA